MRSLALALVLLLATPVAAQAPAGDPTALIRQGRALVLQRRPEEALPLLDQAAELGAPRATVAAQRAIALDMTGELRAAQQDYTLALAANPGDAETVQRMALSLALSGNSGAALTLMQRLGSETGGARRTLALVHALGGRLSDAAEIAAATASIDEARRLRAFYADLPKLPLRERAIAVHMAALPDAPAAAMAAAVPVAPSSARSAEIVVTPIDSPAFAAAPVGRVAVPAAMLAARSRLWVQISSSPDRATLGGDWDRLRAAAGDVLDGQTPYVQRFGPHNRLLVGPFATEGTARALIARLKARRLDAILNRTPAGAELVPLDP